LLSTYPRLGYVLGLLPLGWSGMAVPPSRSSLLAEA
jgi:hypothetical protein